MRPVAEVRKPERAALEAGRAGAAAAPERLVHRDRGAAGDSAGAGRNPARDVPEPAEDRLRDLRWSLLECDSQKLPERDAERHAALSAGSRTGGRRRERTELPGCS